MKINFKSLMGAALLAAVTAMPAGVRAEKSVVVVASDGTETVRALADVQRIDIGAEGITLHDAAGRSSQLAYADVDRILIGAERAAVKEILGKGDIAVWPTTTSAEVNISGLEAGAAVAAHSLSGAAVAAATADADGNAVLDLGGMAEGVYIVSAAGHSVKIIKK